MIPNEEKIIKVTGRVTVHHKDINLKRKFQKIAGCMYMWEEKKRFICACACALVSFLPFSIFILFFSVR